MNQQDDFDNRDGWSHYRQPLTVSDVERLAKAGVIIKFEDIAAQVMRDAPPPDETFKSRYLPMVDAFWERWRWANNTDLFRDGETFHLYAFEQGDKVIAIVSDGISHVIIEDEKCLYPSDALMAKLHLWRQAK